MTFLIVILVTLAAITAAALTLPDRNPAPATSAAGTGTIERDERVK